jgi:hypothetical protein
LQVKWLGAGAGAATENHIAFAYSARTSTLYTKAKEGHGDATAAEAKTIGEWIDLGMQRNDERGPQYGMPNRVFQDDCRPTLFLDSPRRKEASPVSVLRFGAYDYQSGPVARSVKASWPVNGRAAGDELSDLFTASDSVWTLPLTEAFTGTGQITVVATDTTGNEQRVVRDFVAGNAPPPLPDDCAAQIAALQAQIDALKAAQTADHATILELQAKINAAKAALQ